MKTVSDRPSTGFPTRQLEALPAVLEATDAQGRLVMVSDGWLALFGHERHEVLGRKASDFVCEASRTPMQEAIWPALLESGRCENVEYQMLARDGRVVDVMACASLERDADGRPLRCLTVLVDITQRHLTRLELERRELRIDHLIDGANAGTWEWNVQTGEVRVNERWAQIIGYSLAELWPLSIQVWYEHTHPDDLLRSDELLERHFAGETERYHCEARMRHRDGHWVWVLDRGRLSSRTADGRPEWMVGTHVDISPRKSQEEALRKSELFLDRTSRIAGVGGWEIDLAEGHITFSAQTCRIHGVPDDYWPTMDQALAFYPPEARAVMRTAIDEAMSLGKPFDVEQPFIRADGQRIWVRDVGSVEFDEAGQPARVVGAIQDVTDRVAERQALQEANERIALATDGAGIGISDWGLADRTVVWDAWMYRLYGLPDSSTPMTYARWRELVHPDDLEPLERTAQEMLEAGRQIEVDFRVVWPDGSVRQLRSSARVTESSDGSPERVVGVTWDVTESRRLSAELSHRATHDALTGLVNRSEFESRLHELLDHAQRDQSQHALLYIDLDQFKVVNDACGHAVGDRLLQQAAKVMGDAIRSSDTLARLGGDEFGILLADCSELHAQRVAQKICDCMDDFRFSVDERRLRIGASIGMVPVDRRWESISAILQAADNACYLAKDAGRNRVHLWLDTDLAMQARTGEMQWATRIEQALDDNRWALYAQRIHPLRKGAAGLHAEVLLRMLGPDGEVIAPGAFLPAAERYQLASRIDRWVLGHALAWLQALPSLDFIDTLSVNLSGQSIGDRAFHRWATELLAQAGADVRRHLCLEITETAAVTNFADALLFIDLVRAEGVRVALDDFGAGASSFGYLKRLPVDYLKIDGQFIRNLVDDPLDAAAVRCFIDVAHVMGIQTVAEFVDRPEVLAQLRTLGVDFAQGYLLHRPAPIDALCGVNLPQPA